MTRDNVNSKKNKLLIEITQESQFNYLGNCEKV